MKEVEALADAGARIGLAFTSVERALMLPEVNERLDAYLTLRDYELDNRVPPSLFFQPLPAGTEVGSDSKPPRWSEPEEIDRPANLEDVAFYFGRAASLPGPDPTGDLLRADGDVSYAAEKVRAEAGGRNYADRRDGVGAGPKGG